MPTDFQLTAIIQVDPPRVYRRRSTMYQHHNQFDNNRAMQLLNALTGSTIMYQVNFQRRLPGIYAYGHQPSGPTNIDVRQQKDACVRYVQRAHAGAKTAPTNVITIAYRSTT